MHTACAADQGTMVSKRIIVGITGASGVVYGVRLVQVLGEADSEIHLIVSEAARTIMEHEMNADDFSKISKLSHAVYDDADYAAPISSGSFMNDGMIIAPCSAKTLAAIANGFGATLISRAADVCLKERRRLVVLFRETPVNLAHIENMAMITKMGGIVLPPVPAFYTRPKSIDDIILHSIGKTLDLFGIKHTLYTRWKGNKSTNRS